MLKIKKYEGLIAAPFTPLDKNGNLNTNMIPRYYTFLEKNGIAGAFINGTTGECASMTQKEKMENALKWMECFKSGGKVRVINLVGGTSYHECIENAVFSYETGIEAIAMTAPYYFKPSDCGHLAEFVARVGESVPDMPVYFYHIPVLTGVYMPMRGFLEMISAMLPNFAGIKYTHEDFMDFMWCLSYKDGAYDMLWGRDECMLSALVLGTKGFIGSTYNYAAPVYYSIIKAFNEGNLFEARALQNKSIGMISLLGKYGGMGTGKAFMRYVGIDCGKFRLPVTNMDEVLYEEFVKDIRKLDIEELFSKID
jgi:N-acetylneuraminate lyase